MIDFLLNSSNILTPILTCLIGMLSSFLLSSSLKKAKTKKIVCNVESNILISNQYNDFENLKIEFNGEIVKSLTSTTIRIKNVGNKVITSEDFSQSSPLMIKTTIKFLLNNITSYKVFKTNPLCNVLINKLDDCNLLINIDFLNPKDEISFTLLHIGEISFSGLLKDGIIKIIM